MQPPDDNDGGDAAQPPPDGYLIHAGYAFDGDGSCISAARHHATAFLDRTRAAHHLAVSDRARDLTVLVVSELVTNVLKYAPGPVLMELRATAETVDVVVRDSDPTLPTPKTADPGRVGQHGMEIVKAVTEALFIEQETVGKRITARIALTDTLSPA
ncbi:ATP-binding protein [Streptomyces sp. cmx-4-7]|uniref:ATP-binding protein n=1 Tax=Streptomyces sp. cmx-4-7 TaxID=2790939 RepID=UPI00397F0FED